MLYLHSLCTATKPDMQVKLKLFSRHSEMPLRSWHKQDNMLPVSKSSCWDKSASVSDSQSWAFNQCYSSSEICNAMCYSTFYLLLFDDAGKKQNEWLIKSNDGQNMSWWVRSKEEVCSKRAQGHSSHELLHFLCQSHPPFSSAKIRLK